MALTCLQCWEGELERLWIVHKAREMYDQCALWHHARVLPAYLMSRVSVGHPLPELEINGTEDLGHELGPAACGGHPWEEEQTEADELGGSTSSPLEDEGDKESKRYIRSPSDVRKAEEREEEMHATLVLAIRDLEPNLYNELMLGLRCQT